MAFPIFYQGQILFRDGVFATSTACCCLPGCPADSIFAITISAPEVDETYLTSDYDIIKLDGWHLRLVTHERGFGLIAPPDNAFSCNLINLVYERCLTEGADDSEFAIAAGNFVDGWNVAQTDVTIGAPAISSVALPVGFATDEEILNALVSQGILSLAGSGCDTDGSFGTFDLALSNPPYRCPC